MKKHKTLKKGRRHKKRVTPAFLYTLGIISIIGFIAIIGNTWFNFEWLTKNTESLMLIVLGIGLFFEGQVLLWKKMARDGLSSDEIAHMITGIIGMLSVIIGLINFIGITSLTVDAIKGVVASIAVVIIGIQIWLVK